MEMSGDLEEPTTAASQESPRRAKGIKSCSPRPLCPGEESYQPPLGVCQTVWRGTKGGAGPLGQHDREAGGVSQGLRPAAVSSLLLPQEDSAGQSGDQKELPGEWEGSQNKQGYPLYSDLAGVTGASGQEDPGGPGPSNILRLSLRDSNVGSSGSATR